MGNFFAELKRRQMFRAAAAYAVVGWVLLQLVNNLTPALRLPEWAATLVVVLIVVGFPIALVFCWIGHLPTDGAVRQKTSRVDWILVSGLAAVVLLIAYQQLAPNVATSAQQGGVDASKAAANSPAGAISVAVLPFTNLSSDKEQEFFSDGITDEIGTTLAKIPDLRVVARQSAYRFKDGKEDARAIGQALSATHLLEGSVRKAGSRVRISAELVKANDGLRMWAENYDRELTDVFAIQEDIAKAIAASLRVPLGLRQGQSLVANRDIDADSYQQYLRAKALVRGRGLKGLTDAAALLEQVVARYSDYAPGWALLALAHNQTPRFYPEWIAGSTEELRKVVDANIPRAEAAARKAIQLDPNLADGYTSLGVAEHRRSRLVEAEATLSKALALDPGNPDALQAESNLLAAGGYLKEAVAMKQRLVALEPFAPVFSTTLGQAMWMSGLPGAEAFIQKDNNNLMMMPMVYAGAGRYAEAADSLLHLPAGTAPAEAIAAAMQLLRTAPTRATPPETRPSLGHLGFVYLYSGAPERALEVYERNVEAGYVFGLDSSFVWHSSFAPVRKTERFKTYVRSAGLTDYWRAKGWPEFCRPTTGDDFVCN